MTAGFDTPRDHASIRPKPNVPRLCRIACVAVAMAVITSPPLNAQSPPDALTKFLRSYLAPVDSDHSTSYAFSLVNLDTDAANETVVYPMGDDWCGSGGCTALVLKANGESFRVVGRILTTRLPIQLLDSRTNGWRDLAARVQGGGVIRPYYVILRFNGKRYPGSAGNAPRLRPPARLTGNVLIDVDPPTIDLYP